MKEAEVTHEQTAAQLLVKCLTADGGEAHDALVAALRAAEHSGASRAGQEGWIAVSERLPPPGEWVLAHRPGHHMRMFNHTGWGWRKENGTMPSHSLEYTHWRPLPPPPPVKP